MQAPSQTPLFNLSKQRLSHSIEHIIIPSFESLYLNHNSLLLLNGTAFSLSEENQRENLELSRFNIYEKGMCSRRL